MASRLLWSKGIQQYHDAAYLIKKKNKFVDFYLLGFVQDNNHEGITKNKLMDWNKEGIIKYLGHTNNVITEMIKYDCIVLPTYYNEGVPHVLLEASALKIPVITTKIPGCEDAVVDDYNGLLCNPKDTHDLFSKMEKF